jgi:hypothetical protein
MLLHAYWQKTVVTATIVAILPMVSDTLPQEQ